MAQGQKKDRFYYEDDVEVKGNQPWPVGIETIFVAELGFCFDGVQVPNIDGNEVTIFFKQETEQGAQKDVVTLLADLQKILQQYGFVIVSHIVTRHRAAKAW